MKWFFVLSMTVTALIAVACTTVATPTAPLAAQWLNVASDSALDIHRGLMAECTPSGYGVAYETILSPASEPTNADLILTWGKTREIEGFSAEIGRDELVAIVNPDNSIPSINLDDLRLIYQGQLTDWDWQAVGGPSGVLTAYAYTPLAAETNVLKAGGLFTDNAPLSREVVQAPSTGEMRSAIANDPGGIGFLARSWVDESVRVLPVNGLPAGAWQVPLLSISSTEPQGAARDWLLCVQQGLN